MALAVYGARWRRLSRIFLLNNPLCVFHLRRGRDVIATVVDHIKPPGGDPVLFLDQDNWQSLCGTCHNEVKQAEERSGVIRGADADGLPLDPSHHWHVDD